MYSPTIRSWLLWSNHAQLDTVTVTIRNIARIVFKLSTVRIVAYNVEGLGVVGIFEIRQLVTAAKLMIEG